MRDTKPDLAELYVAGLLANAGWSVYFPRRDEGIDFIVTKLVRGKLLVRPIQVKGKYPTATKTNKKRYGLRGKLTQVHPHMILAIPYFPTDNTETAPSCVAYMPYKKIKGDSPTRCRCQPARFRDGIVVPLDGCKKYFDSKGLARLEGRA